MAQQKMTAETWRNLVSMFFDQAEALGEKPFLWIKRDGAFRPMSWAATARQVAKMAGALKSLGVQKGDRVALVSENRPEWLIADHAIMAIGAISVPVYTTYTSRDYLHVLDNSGAKAVIISTAKLAQTVLPAAHQALALKHAICIEKPKLAQRINCALHDWAELRDASPTGVEEARGWAAEFQRQDMCSLIYTSGTGGAPRGVKQHHGGVLHNCAGAIDVLKDVGVGHDVFLSFLPLSHAYEHTGGQFLPISVGAQIFYAEGLDKLAGNIEETRPTIMVVVPRLFEVLRQRISRGIEKQGGLAVKLFERTQEIGVKRLADPKSLTLWERILDRFLDIAVRRKVRARFGGRVKALVSGGAPLNPEVGAFFMSLGLRLLQGYGQTEAHPVISVNRCFDMTMDTVGPPLKDTEVRIADDGEILVRGELVMQGYWRDEDATAEVIRDGWLHTGDIGHFDAAGRIKITDRKKDIIVNDKGDNVSPQRIEGMLCLEPEIAQAMVYGDKKPYLVGLLVPDAEWFEGWKRREGRSGDLAQLHGDPDLVKALDAAVARVNQQLSNLEKVRKAAALPEAFSIENRMMTPKLSIRRHIISDAYGGMIDALYGAKP